MLEFTVGAVVAPTPSTLRITNGWEGKATTPVVKSRAFQLTAKEARVTPYIVKGIFSICLCSFIDVYAYVSYRNV